MVVHTTPLTVLIPQCAGTSVKSSTVIVSGSSPARWLARWSSIHSVSSVAAKIAGPPPVSTSRWPASCTRSTATVDADVVDGVVAPAVGSEAEMAGALGPALGGAVVADALRSSSWSDPPHCLRLDGGVGSRQVPG